MKGDVYKSLQENIATEFGLVHDMYYEIFDFILSNQSIEHWPREMIEDYSTSSRCLKNGEAHLNFPLFAWSSRFCKGKIQKIKSN